MHFICNHNKKMIGGRIVKEMIETSHFDLKRFKIKAVFDE